MNRGIRENNEDKYQSGLTLVALVITVIMLLILAGVALSYTTMNAGLFARTNHAGHEYNESAQEEATRFNVLNEYVEKYYTNN